MDWAGLDLHTRVYNAALGLSFMTSTSRDPHECMSLWMTYGRHAFLPEAAALFGMRVRALHPPAAAVGLQGSQEFVQHFEASYKPLIEKALENSQPVLAWRGWPDYREAFWGIITETHDSAIGFQGTTMWSRSLSVPLVTCPLLCYVVEETSPRMPDHRELLKFSILNAQKVLHNRLDGDFGLITGPEAYEPWLERLAGDPQCVAHGVSANHCHLQMTRFVTYARQSAIRFLSHYRDGLSEDLQPLVDTLMAQCQGIGNALATSAEQTSVETLYHTKHGRETLATSVRGAQAFEQSIMSAIDELAAQL